MASQSGQDKTEKPTGKRLKDAREKGQMARSQRAPRAAALAGAMAAFGLAGETTVGTLVALLRDGLGSLGDQPHRVLADGDLMRLVVEGGRILAVGVGPLAVGCIVAVVGIQVAQGGWNLSTTPLMPDLSRLSPASGIKRLFGQGPLNVLFLGVSVFIVAWLAWAAVEPVIRSGGVLARLAPLDAARVGWHTAWRLLTRVTIVVAVMAAADYAFTRWRFMRGLRMTKQEVKDEMKTTEGNPLIKSRIRSLQRELARKRMLADVKRATVVITNPTHFAIALEYRRAAMAAPRVLAKGREKLALRIRQEAREHGVPIVENKPLAQALYFGAEVGDVIPAALFEAVAEVLAYLIRLKRLAL